MSTTAKEEKPSLLDGLKAQAADIAAKIKEETDKHLGTLHERLQDAHKLVQSLTAEIESHTGKPLAKKRGRKPGSVKKTKTASSKPAKATRKGKAKRGAVGEAIQKFLATKGAKGAHVKEIAAEIGNKVPNVTSFFYSPTGKAKYKNLGKATFALKK